MACRGSGVRVPSAPPKPQVRATFWILIEEKERGPVTLITQFAPQSRAERPAAWSGSAGFAHLRCMESATTSPSPTTAPLENAVVVTGVFEPALSVQQLAEELHVSA